MIALLLLVVMALACAGAHAQAQNNPTAPPNVDKVLDTARAQIDKVQKRLEALPGKPMNDAQLAELRSTAMSAQEAAHGVAANIEPQLTSVQARMAELGQPAEGMKDTPDVALQRAQLNKSSTTLDAQLKLARLIAVEAEQAADQILKLRRTQFQAELGARTTSILDPAFWSELDEAFPEDMGRLEPLRAELKASARVAGPSVWSVVLLAVIVLAALRHWAGHVLMRITTTRVAPGRLRRSLYAAARVALGTLVPGLIAEIVRYALGWSAPLSDDLNVLLDESVSALYFAGFVSGLGRALLAADRPTWRLSALHDDIARRLRWLPAVLAVAIVAGWVLQRLAALVNASLVATVAIDALMAVILAAVFGLALARSKWRRNGDAADEAPPAAVYAPFWLGVLRSLAWAALAASLASLVLGYVALGSFIVKQLTWTAIVLGSAYLLAGLVGDAAISVLASIRRTAADEGLARPMTRLRSQATVLASGLGQVLVALLALAFLMLPLGSGPADWLEHLKALPSSITIGEVEVRPTAMLLSAAVLVLGFGAVRLLQQWLGKQYLPTTSLDPGMRISATTLFGYAGYVTVVALSLSAVGIGLERVAWIASALSVGIGFGLQAVVQNFVSGLILLAERPVKVGDWVSLGGVEGDIRRINVRATEIQMGDRSTVIVPNSEFITKVVRNVTHASPLGRVQIRLAMPVTTDVDAAHDLILSAFTAHEEMLPEPAADVMLEGVDASGLIFVATGYVSTPRITYRVRSALLFTIIKKLNEAGMPLSNPPVMVMKESAA
ncbi:mechanosensitive ion channel family protein [Parapusillimonas sp. SGNA-6]|nr:mechanosensitive ion channel family protein [Parapusillimonas sp. SGNA-6]